ncbi:MAG: IS110 family transposase [Acidimicrobiaceae bacterium]|nr:IS110 family transposase [Acidimicrobiaceae bacterium]
MHSCVIGGVDTDKEFHCAAALDETGRLLGTEEFPTTKQGINELQQWLEGFGDVEAVGVEGTGSYGAELTRRLHGNGTKVLEVPRPNRQGRRRLGKSDPIDAEAAARSVMSGQAVIVPKLGSSQIECIRMLRVTRQGALKAKIAATNTLKSMVITAPGELRDQLLQRNTQQLIATCRSFRVRGADPCDPLQGTKLACNYLAQRIHHLSEEIDALDAHLETLVTQVAPKTLSVFGMGVGTVAALLVTIGDNPERLMSDASFARLCGVAPIPASSGNVTRYRLHRGGVRDANSALHVAVIVRLRYCTKTKAYMERRTAEGLSKMEVIRCLKRYLIREVLRALRSDYENLQSV